jgi:hypothetical protein
MFGSDLTRGQIIENLHGHLSAWMHLPGILRDRYRIQRSRTVSTAYIDGLLYRQMPPAQRSLASIKKRLQGSKS